MQRALKLCGAVAVLCSVAWPVRGAPREPAAVAEATVEELPQRPMTLQNGYHPGLFPFNKGEPFVVDPDMGAIDFNTKPPPGPQQRSDEYYDYDASKLEEVPFDYKGDPIDRKDVVEPNVPRPNDIKPNGGGGGGGKNKQTDIYHFLNLPVKYSSSDKFPLMSSSYANTKIQGSGPSSSSLSNHKMPEQPSTTTSAPAPTTSWYNNAAVKSAGTTVRPAITTTARPATTTTTTTTTPQPQEYEEESAYDYDYYHPQEPAPVSDTAPVTASSKTTTTTSAVTATTAHQNPPSTTAAPFRTTVAISSPATATTSTTSSTTAAHATSTGTPSDVYGSRDDDDDRPASVANRTAATTARPEIDSKLDGTSFADYDAIRPADGDEHRPAQQHEPYGAAAGPQRFKPMPGHYPFADDKPYPLITNGKVPMTFTAHVSSGISLNQKEPAQQQQQQHHHHQPLSSDPKRPPPPAVSEPPAYTFDRSPPPAREPDADDTASVHDGPKPATSSPSSGSRPSAPQPSSAYSPKPKPPRPGDSDPYETVYYKVRPDAQPFPGATAANRPSANPPPPPPIHGRPAYQPEPPAVAKPSHAADRPSRPAEPQPRPQQPYPAADAYAVKGKQPAAPQYAAPQSQPDTSKFKPPKHVINHFIKTQPNEDNKSYALQTSFSIGMDGERTAEARPGQGVGQVLMVHDGGPSSAEPTDDQTAVAPAAAKPPAAVNRATTSIPFVPPPRPAHKPAQQQQYPRPQWENVPKPPAYYPPPQSTKRDGSPPPPPPQRSNLPNILPQFRPNAKVDAPPMMMTPAQSPHSATIERVQIPMDHLRPPPLPKPQFLKVDRSDEDAADSEAPAKEPARAAHRATGPQPARVTTLQMIQHGAAAAPAKALRKDDGRETVHVVYAANGPPPRPQPADRLHADDAALLLLDAKDRADVPVLKTKAPVNRPVKTEFPYQIVRPDDVGGQGASAGLEYKAYSPARPDAARPSDQELVPNLQDYVPVVTRAGDPAAGVAPPQRPIAATLRTSEDNHKAPEDNHRAPEDGGHKPQLQNFQIPFQPSMKLPENSNGWSVVRKPQTDSASERMDEAGDAAASTEKFDPDNFKPQLVGGFMPINPLAEEDKDKKTVEQQPERA